MMVDAWAGSAGAGQSFFLFGSTSRIRSGTLRRHATQRRNVRFSA